MVFKYIFTPVKINTLTAYVTLLKPIIDQIAEIFPKKKMDNRLLIRNKIQFNVPRESEFDQDVIITVSIKDQINKAIKLSHDYMVYLEMSRLNRPADGKYDIPNFNDPNRTSELDEARSTFDDFFQKHMIEHKNHLKYIVFNPCDHQDYVQIYRRSSTKLDSTGFPYMPGMEGNGIIALIGIMVPRKTCYAMSEQGIHQYVGENEEGKTYNPKIFATEYITQDFIRYHVENNFGVKLIIDGDGYENEKECFDTQKQRLNEQGVVINEKASYDCYHNHYHDT